VQFQEELNITPIYVDLAHITTSEEEDECSLDEDEDEWFYEDEGEDEELVEDMEVESLRECSGGHVCHQWSPCYHPMDKEEPMWAPGSPTPSYI